ncbi:uncharacterized protein ARMOST_05148 [Armillaria ostoyae]|uniref:F-box domain-containing protein n=1 Tax=Armillaria ostoyae TaxID=47428 RepID=A0A284QZC7_ARMOS|nr:uncharacterized protein ARMOST_05148 [Armillaria ostoyae]
MSWDKSSEVYTHPDILQRLLTTNHPPTPEDIGPLEESRKSVRHSLLQVQKEIRILQQSLTALKRKQAQLLVADDELRGVLSPIRRLPREILAEILSLVPERKPRSAYHDDKAVQFHDVFDTFTGYGLPWTLSYVCQEWRTVVTSLCPQLWTNLHIESYPEPLKNPVALLREVLKRSGNRPLCIKFRLWCMDDNMPTVVHAIAVELFQAIVSCCHRWRVVEMDIKQHLWPALHPILACGPLPFLEALEINCYSYSSNSDTSPTAYRPVTLDSHPYLHKILSGSPKLRDFSLSYDAENDGLPSRITTTPIRCESMRTLTAFDVAIFESLELPRLEDLNVSTLQDDVPDFHGPDEMLSVLHALVLRSRPPLVHLFLTDTIIDDNLLRIIALTPALATLKFHFQQWLEEFDVVFQELMTRLGQVVPLTGAHHLVPGLQLFSVEIQSVANASQHVDFVNQRFVSVVMSRWIPPQRVLKTILIEADAEYRLSSADVRNLKVCQAQGLEISIVGEYPDGRIKYV